MRQHRQCPAPLPGISNVYMCSRLIFLSAVWPSVGSPQVGKGGCESGEGNLAEGGGKD